MKDNEYPKLRDYGIYIVNGNVYGGRTDINSNRIVDTNEGVRVYCGDASVIRCNTVIY